MPTVNPLPRRLAVLALLAPLLACGGSPADEAGTAGGGTDPTPERRFLSLGTAPPGGAFFVVGGALAEVLGVEHPSWQVTAEATKGTGENLRRLMRGELDLALANAAITYHAVRGEGTWNEPQPIRSVMTLAPNVALFLTRSDSGIASIADLAGERVVVGPAGASFELFVRPIVEAHGLAWDAFDPLHATQATAVDLLGDGSAAAAFLGGAVPTASISQATASGGVVFLPYDPEVVEELVATYPFFRSAVIPAGTYRGQEEPFHGLDVGSMHLVTAAAVDEELVHEVTRTLWERRADVAERHPAGRFIRRDNAARPTGTPFHPGAERFYRETGLWPQDG